MRSSSPRNFTGLTALAAAVALSALGATACTTTHEAPNLKGQDVRLTVIHTSDIHSRLLPYDFQPGAVDRGMGLLAEHRPFGGIARMAAIIKRERALSSRSIHLDSGDCFQGAPIFNMFSGEAEFRSLSEVGLDAMVLGNHEFDKGVVNLELQQLKFARFPILAANYIFDDPGEAGRPKLGATIRPFTILNADGLRIAVIGMGNVSSLTSVTEGGNSIGVRALGEEQTLKYYVSLLRPQVDVVAVVSHLGLDEDEGLTSRDVDAQTMDCAGGGATGCLSDDTLNGVDLLFGGHLHIVLNPPKVIPHLDADGKQIGQTVIMHSGAFAKFVGRADLLVHVHDPNDDTDEPSGIKSFNYKVFPVAAKEVDPMTNQIVEAPQDPDVVRILEPYQLALNNRFDLNRVFAYINTPCMETGIKDCVPRVSSFPKVVRNDTTGGDSQLGNLVAASMRLRSRVEADFAITNSLGIRADFEQGPLTIEAMFNVFPFENSITTMFLSGQEVQETLDFVSRKSAERGCRTQIQISGLYFDMNCKTQDPAHDRPGKAENVFIGDGCRLPDGGIDETKCKRLDPSASYRVAVNDYIANGGSGFTVLKQNTTKFNTGIALREALVDYLQTLPSRCEDGKMPSADNRYVGLACIGPDVEAHDGRIKPIAGDQ